MNQLLYSDEILASMTDGELAPHYYDNLRDVGPSDDTTKRCKGEVRRRKLSRQQLDEARAEFRRQYL